MDNFKISIILPTYNGEKYLRKSIDSCLNQTYQNIELIIINDGSTDGTSQIINSYQDQRIKQIILPVNQGIVNALNKGFSESKGDFLTWTSDDNYYDAKAMDMMLKSLQNNSGVDFVYANYHMINDDGDIMRSGHVEDPQGLDVDNYIGGCFLYRRNVYETIGDFNPEAFLVEDYEYWLRVRAQFSMKKLEDFLYYYRMHDDTLTIEHGLEKIQAQVEKIRDPYLEDWKRLFLHGKKYFYKKDFDMSRQFLLKSLVSHPLHYQTWRLLIKSILKV